MHVSQFIIIITVMSNGGLDARMMFGQKKKKKEICKVSLAIIIIIVVYMHKYYKHACSDSLAKITKMQEYTHILE